MCTAVPSKCGTFGGTVDTNAASTACIGAAPFDDADGDGCEDSLRSVKGQCQPCKSATSTALLSVLGGHTCVAKDSSYAGAGMRS